MAKIVQSRRVELVLVVDEKPVKMAGNSRGGLVYLDDGSVAMQCGKKVYKIKYIRVGEFHE